LRSQKHRQLRNEAVVIDGEVVAGEEGRVGDGPTGELDPAVAALDDRTVDMERRHNVGEMSAVKCGDLVAASVERTVGSLKRSLRREQSSQRLLAVSGGDLDIAIGSDTRIRHAKIIAEPTEAWAVRGHNVLSWRSDPVLGPTSKTFL
jgi:hypothetical protein